MPSGPMISRFDSNAARSKRSIFCGTSLVPIVRMVSDAWPKDVSAGASLRGKEKLPIAGRRPCGPARPLLPASAA
eukprot:164440-Prymnesium_polylepis.1